MRRKLTAIVVALVIAAVSVTTALATPALGGFVSTLLARGTLTTPVDANADGVNYVTFIVPTGAALRIDTPNPGCAVE